MRTHVGSRTRKIWAQWGVSSVAIAVSLLFSAVGRAQQALPPPPSIPNATAFPDSNGLPSLTPVPPPGQGYPMAPAVMPPPSVYPASNTVPGMVPGATMTPPAGLPVVKASFYQVVVPTRPEEFNAIASKLMSMGVRPDAIRSSYRPLGPHVAVGPFVNQKEAEGVSQYLRAGGMNARVFFTR